MTIQPQATEKILEGVQIHLTDHETIFNHTGLCRLAILRITNKTEQKEAILQSSCPFDSALASCIARISLAFII